MSQRYGRWEDAMLAQTRLLEWSESQLGARYLLGFFQDQNDKHTPAARKDPLLMAGLQLETLRLAEPIYVSSDVCELIDEARKTWRPEKLNPGDLFAQRGFLMLPRPILLDDMPVTERNPWRAPPADGKLNGYIPVRAIGWLPIHSEDLSEGTVWISYYVNAEDEFELADENGWASRFDIPIDGYEDDPEARRRELMRKMPLTLVHQWQWSWGTSGVGAMDWDDPDHYDVQPEDSVDQMIERAKQQTGLVQTIWRLGSQLVHAREKPQRQMWRDANRKGIPHKEVTVITLRRYREPHELDHDGDGRELRVRFIVRGHWRNQWYPSLADHRQIWISPYVKGPEDAPLRLTTRAWEFVR